MRSKLRIPKRAWTLIHLSLLAWVAWVMAGMVNGFITSSLLPVPSPAVSTYAPAAAKAAFEPEPDYSSIIRRNIFNSSQKPEDVEDYSAESAAIPAEGESTPDAPRTKLGLRLIGTVADDEGQNRFAAIEVKDTRDQRLYRLNDTILGAKIVTIERDRVLLMLEDGRRETLEIDFADTAAKGKKLVTAKRIPGLESGADVSQLGEGDFAVSKRYLDAQLQNMSRLLTEARAIPNIGKDGVADGFKLFAIKKGSIFEKVGFQNHDVIKRVNGVPLDSAEKGLELFQALRNETNFEVDLVRKSQKTSLRFTIQ